MSGRQFITGSSLGRNRNKTTLFAKLISACLVLSLVLVLIYGFISTRQANATANKFVASLFSENAASGYDALTMKAYRDAVTRDEHVSQFSGQETIKNTTDMNAAKGLLLNDEQRYNGVINTEINGKEVNYTISLSLVRSGLGWKVNTVSYDFQSDNDADNAKSGYIEYLKKQGIEVRDLTTEEKNNLEEEAKSAENS